MKITKEIGIDYAHRVPNHKSKCKNPHGHRARIIATVDDKVITEPGASNQGMVIDFGDLKQAMMDVLDTRYDHGAIYWENDPMVPFFEQALKMNLFNPEKFHVVDYIPTAENLAKNWFLELSSELSSKYKIKLYSLEVFETPTSSAIYTIDNFNEEQ